MYLGMVCGHMIHTLKQMQSFAGRSTTKDTVHSVAYVSVSYHDPSSEPRPLTDSEGDASDNSREITGTTVSTCCIGLFFHGGVGSQDFDCFANFTLYLLVNVSFQEGGAMNVEKALTQSSSFSWGGFPQKLPLLKLLFLYNGWLFANV